jgi:hypothetical protein
MAGILNKYIEEFTYFSAKYCASNLRSASLITSPSLVRQNGGIEFKSIEPYLLLTIRESKIATTPRSSNDLINRPVP